MHPCEIFFLLHFSNLLSNLQITEQSFSYFYARFVMAHKACFEHFYAKVSGTLITDNVGKGYDCLYDLFLNFQEVLMSLIITSLTSSSVTSVITLFV